MIGRYAIVAARIRQELARLEQVVDRAERATAAASQRAADNDLYLDSAALSLHDFYAGLERIFRQIATDLDRSMPSGCDWHQELLQQMTVGIVQIRPSVLSAQAVRAVDEFLRFRHVVQNIYAFELDPERVQMLVQRLRPAFGQARAELLAFADFLDRSAREG